MMNFLLRKVEDLICADKSWIVLLVVPLMLSLSHFSAAMKRKNLLKIFQSQSGRRTAQ